MKSFNQPTQSNHEFGNPIINYNFGVTAGKKRIAKKKVLKNYVSRIRFEWEKL